MKIIISIVAMFIGFWGTGLVDKHASDAELILGGLACVIITLLCFSLRDTKILHREIIELKEKINHPNEKDSSNEENN